MGDKHFHATENLINLFKVWFKGGTGLLITGNVMIESHALGEHGNVVVEDESGLSMLKE